MWQNSCENLKGRLREIFTSKNYDDKNHKVLNIFIEFTVINRTLPTFKLFVTLNPTDVVKGQ